MGIRGYLGPVAVATDCTKVRPRLSYSHTFDGHILGSTLDMTDCYVQDAETIEAITDRIADEKAIAKQARAIIMQVIVPSNECLLMSDDTTKIPLPGYPPIVVGLLPNSGADNGEDIYMLLCKVLTIAKEFGIHTLTFAADGATPERNAQDKIDSSSADRFEYTNEQYGGVLYAAIIPEIGPVVPVQDAGHGRKTARNQPLYGTHTTSMGIGVITARLFVVLYRIPGASIHLRDVTNIDLQCDGAPRRLFLFLALLACTEETENGRCIKPGMEGLFVYFWIFGTFTYAFKSR